MSRTGIHSLIVALCLLGALSFSRPAMADPVTMTFVTEYNAGAVLGGVYDDPYWVLIDGIPTLAICDDFFTEVHAGQTWSADVYTLSDIGTSGPQKFTGAPVPYTIQQEYNAAGLLAEDLMASLNDPTLVGEYSYAIWTLFDPSAIWGHDGSATNPYLTPTQQDDVNTLRTAALTAVLQGVTPSDSIFIYTPDPKNASQEFLVVKTPEASVLVFLALDLAALLGLALLIRRKSAAQN